MSSFKFFTQSDRAPEIFGPIGRGDIMEKFHSTFKIRIVKNTKISIVGRKNNTPGCFSIVRCGDGWDIAWYEDMKPSKVQNYIVDGQSVDAEYFESDPLNKYLAMDFIKILRDQNIAI